MATLPGELAGEWVNVLRGNAEIVYRFRTDGTYDRASVLVQERPSGTFSFTTTARGNAKISGNVLTLTHRLRAPSPCGIPMFQAATTTIGR